MKESIRILSEKVLKYPDAKVTQEEDSLIVSPNLKTGFPVSFYDYDSEAVVSYGGWHDSFKDKEEALNWFTFGLSSSCRLQVHSRGTFEYKWIVQSFENEKWVNKDENSIIFFPYWRKRKILYLQNNLWEGI